MKHNPCSCPACTPSPARLFVARLMLAVKAPTALADTDEMARGFAFATFDQTARHLGLAGAA